MTMSVHIETLYIGTAEQRRIVAALERLGWRRERPPGQTDWRATVGPGLTAAQAKTLTDKLNRRVLLRVSQGQFRNSAILSKFSDCFTKNL